MLNKIYLPLMILPLWLSATELSFAGCLDDAPKPSAAVEHTCNELGTFGYNRGAHADLPYEKAPDGLWKEHRIPMGPSTDLLDFTKANTGKLRKIILEATPTLCAYSYSGKKFNLKNGKENMAFVLLRHKSSKFNKALLNQVMTKENNLTVQDIAKLAIEYSQKAQIQGDLIFEDQLLAHAGALEPSYRQEYLQKTQTVLASLNKDTKEYLPSDCDYLNAPINNLYGIIQFARLAEEIVQESCPNEYESLGLREANNKLRKKIEIEWPNSARSAVTDDESELDVSDKEKNSENSILAK